MTDKLALYIHLPWCLKKCFYCDFNSYPISSVFDEKNYLCALKSDFKNDQNLLTSGKTIKSIYIGGGTPTLFSASILGSLLESINADMPFASDIEITIEANPGSFDLKKARELYSLGINRLSLGIQSFQDAKLKAIGRIHDAKVAQEAIACARKAHFDNINFDLIYGLPFQSIKEAVDDLKMAMTFEPQHLSWYQLTIEPGTVFYSSKPNLPDEDLISELEFQGKKVLIDKGFEQYEISAYSKCDFKCKHNLNYWLFGDYLGIGAGAHGKVTNEGVATRYHKIKNPAVYMAREEKNSFFAEKKIIPREDLPLEFLLNALRLLESTSIKMFNERTGCDFEKIKSTVDKAKLLGLMQCDDKCFSATKLGHNFLNDLLGMFVDQNF